MKNTKTPEKEMQGGAELTVAAMDKSARSAIGRKTYLFVRRCMQDPVLREKIKVLAAEIQNSETE